MTHRPRTTPLNLLLPWSLASYVPLNGFHPLYRSLASLARDDIRLLVPKPLSGEQYRQAIMAGVYAANALPQTPTWAQNVGRRFTFRDYAAGHIPAEMLYAARIAADVELHHTAPVTMATRPFLLQFESFLPVFFPHFQQGYGPVPPHVDAIRNFFSAIFENEYCLAVTSHIQSSLDQFSDFFRSAKIDKKLVHLRNGIDPVFRSRFTGRNRERFDFLFINSAHQNPASFALRGGPACLKLALDLLRDGKPVRFLFRTRRPTDATLQEFDIDPALVKRYENNGIVWIEQYLGDQSLNRLMASCHFLLLPSANLHSVSIMSAMLNGTVPVVTDTYGTDAYVTDGVDGVVLPGVRSAAWRHDADARIIVDNHSSYCAQVAAMSSALIGRMRVLLDQPDRIAALSAAARRRAEGVFDGDSFANGLIDLVQSRLSATTMRMAGSVPAPDLFDVSWAEEWTTDLSAADFEGPPQPVPVLDSGSGRIFRLRNRYIFIPDARMKDTELHHWSELHFATERYETGELPRKAISSDFERVIEAARIETLRQTLGLGTALPPSTDSEVVVMPASIRDRVYHRLKTRPAALRIVRTTYRAMRRLGFLQ